MAHAPESRPFIAGIILAAGLGTRSGGAKMLLPWRGRPLIRHVAEVALGSQLDEIVVVTGHQPADVVAALNGLAVRSAHNADYATGLSSSLRVGIDAVHAEASGAMILLGDQPLLTSEAINRLVDAHRASHAAIVAPWAAGRRGNPVLFDRELFGELRATRGDEGARAIIAAHFQQLELVEVDGAIFEDVDTPEAYERLKSSHGIV